MVLLNLLLTECIELDSRNYIYLILRSGGGLSQVSVLSGTKGIEILKFDIDVTVGF